MHLEWHCLIYHPCATTIVIQFEMHYVSLESLRESCELALPACVQNGLVP